MMLKTSNIYLFVGLTCGLGLRYFTHKNNIASIKIWNKLVQNINVMLSDSVKMRPF